MEVATSVLISKGKFDLQVSNSLRLLVLVLSMSRKAFLDQNHSLELPTEVAFNRNEFIFSKKSTERIEKSIIAIDRVVCEQRSLRAPVKFSIKIVKRLKMNSMCTQNSNKTKLRDGKDSLLKRSSLPERLQLVDFVRLNLDAQVAQLHKPCSKFEVLINNISHF